MQRLTTAAVIVLAALSAGCDAGQQTSTNPAIGSYAARRLLIDVGGGAISSEPGANVNLSFFKAAKIAPLAGRFFTDGDQSQSAVVLSEDLWTRRFGADQSVIGRELEVEQRRMTVVGIAPKSFQFPEGAQLWVLRAP
jgi:hypothetical protein